MIYIVAINMETSTHNTTREFETETEATEFADNMRSRGYVAEISTVGESTNTYTWKENKSYEALVCEVGIYTAYVITSEYTRGYLFEVLGAVGVEDSGYYTTMSHAVAAAERCLDSLV